MGMEQEKAALVEKMEQKGISVAEVAKTIEFNPKILNLYLAKDAYPIPKRIWDKLTAAVGN